MFPYRRLPSHITGLYIFTVINFLILCHMALVQASISVISLETNETVYPPMADEPAYFGGHISYEGIWGQTVYSNPETGCTDIQPPPTNSTIQIAGVKWFVLIMRSHTCSFSKKVLNAQLAGYDAAIIHNVGSDNLEPMGQDKERGILIPSVFIGETDGLRIKNNFLYDKGYLLYITNEIPEPFWPDELNKYLFPFIMLLSVCFLGAIIAMVIKCVRDRNRQRRHRLPTRLLKQLPIKKFKKNDPYDTCAICLDEYIEGEKLRVLPCNHTYHTKCIDPWLTESRRNCPVCKRKVLPRTRRSASDSESDSDSEHERADESTPLIPPGGNVNGERHPTNGGHVNHLWVDDDASEEGGAVIPPPAAAASVASSPGCSRYQSMSSTSWGATSSSSSSTSVAVGIFPVNLLISSGEHSLNGDPIDGASLETQPAHEDGSSGGPVEIAVDVATRGTSSLWSTDNQRKSAASKNNYDLVV